MSEKIGIGDPVEVQFFDRQNGEIWLPATVSYVGGNGIIVVFADGEHRHVENRRGLWRRARGNGDG